VSDADPKHLYGQRIIARVGTGARSVLYVVQDPKTKELATLKHVRLEDSDKDDRWLVQVEQEHVVGTKVTHPCVRGVKQIYRSREGIKFWKRIEVGLLMEFVDGASLDSLPLSSNLQAVQIFSKVARGLAAMHEAGFVHADMKPNNVLVTQDGVKVIDLGQACKVGDTKKRVQGTPGYIAPEQGHRESITAFTDVYNFGATMYWLLVHDVIPTVVPPGSVDGAVKAIPTAKLRRADPPHVRNASVHPDLSKLVLDCVEPQVGDRVRSMAEVADRLDALAGELAKAKDGMPLRLTDRAMQISADL